LNIEKEYKITLQEARKILSQIKKKKKQNTNLNFDRDILKGIEIYAMKYFNLKKYNYALDLFDLLLNIAKEVNDELWIPASMVFIALVYEKMGKIDTALDFLIKSLKYKYVKKSNVLYNIGFIKYHHKGLKDEALDYFNNALIEAEINGDRNTEAITLYYIAEIKHIFGLYSESIDLYSNSKKICEEINNLEYIGKNLIGLAMICKINGEYKESLEKLRESLILYKKMKFSEGIVASLYHIAVIYTSKSEYKKAKAYLQGAYFREEKEGNIQGKAHILTEIGKLLRIKGLYNEALKKHNQALELYEHLENAQGKSVVLNNIGKVYQSKGSFSETLEFYQKALQISRKNNDAENIRANLNNLGSLAHEIGNYQEALNNFQKAFEISNKTKNKEGQRSSKNNIGAIYLKLGKYEKALSELEDALKISLEIGQKHSIAIALNNIGAIHQQTDNLDLAIDSFTRALEIYEEVGDIENIGKTLNNIGGVFSLNKEKTKAYNYYKKALDIFVEIKNINQQTTLLNNIGKLFIDWNKTDEANKCFNDALNLAKRTGNKIAESIIYTNFGILNQKSGLFDLAYEYYCKAIDINELIIGELHSEEIRIDFRITKLNPLKLIVSLLIDWHLNIKEDIDKKNKILYNIIRFLEMQKARETTDTLENEKSLEPNINSNVMKLVIKEKELVKKLNLLYYNYQKEDSKKNEGNLRSKLNNLDDLINEIKQIRLDILNNSNQPGLVKLVSEYDPIEKFKKIFDNDENYIIWYLFYEEKLKPNILYFIIWTKESIKLFVTENFSIKNIIDQVDEFHRVQKRNRDEASHILDNISKGLGMKISDEIWQTIQNKKLLILIPHERLIAIPWGIIVKNQENDIKKASKGSDYLGLKLPMIYCHNLSLLNLCLNRENKDNGEFLFIANPNYNIPKLNLPEADKEIKSILELMKQAQIPDEQIFFIQHENATKDNFQNHLQKNLKIVHFAGHSAYVTEDTWLSHMKFYNEIGEDRLSLTEISQYDYKLSPLFILSSCESMRGNIKQGSESLGFIRILLLLGVTSIIGSNWLLNDSIAPLFMRLFYKELLKGEMVAFALYNAKKILFEDLNLKKPIEWGIYDLFGNPINTIEKSFD